MPQVHVCPFNVILVHIYNNEGANKKLSGGIQRAKTLL